MHEIDILLDIIFLGYILNSMWIEKYIGFIMIFVVVFVSVEKISTEGKLGS